MGRNTVTTETRPWPALYGIIKMKFSTETGLIKRSLDHELSQMIYSLKINLFNQLTMSERSATLHLAQKAPLKLNLRQTADMENFSLDCLPGRAVGC